MTLFIFVGGIPCIIEDILANLPSLQHGFDFFFFTFKFMTYSDIFIRLRNFTICLKTENFKQVYSSHTYYLKIFAKTKRPVQTSDYVSAF